MASRIEGDVYHAGTETFKAIVLPTGAGAPVSNTNIAAGAAIATAKQVHKHRKGYGQPNTTATTETRGIHVCFGATGTVVAFKAGSIVANIGAATVTKNCIGSDRRTSAGFRAYGRGRERQSGLGFLGMIPP